MLGIGREVAPLAGAWIETSEGRDALKHPASHPSRVRGLKRRPCRALELAEPVAPLAGAWIETNRPLRS